MVQQWYVGPAADKGSDPLKDAPDTPRPETRRVEAPGVEPPRRETPPQTTPHADP